MSIATTVALQDFLANPNIHYYDFHELHNGEIVAVSPPSNEPVEIQVRVEALFRSLIPEQYTVLREFYYTLPTESRRADVAVVLESRRREQWKKTFFGSPEILVEVLSDSNKAADVGHLRRICLAGNTEYFLVVDPFERAVEVYSRDGAWRDFRQGEVMEFRFGGYDVQMDVAAVFEG